MAALFFTIQSFAQDFSNRGTDFWTGYGPHEKISSGTSDMTLYFTSDDTATVYIYIGSSLFQTLRLPAGSITASNNIPESGALDARLQNELVYVNKGIYIHSTSPIVAYAQIWGSQVTSTTILFPVKTLGRSYTSLNYTQISNTSGMRSYFFVVATENGTTVEVNPSANTSAGLVAGTWASRSLNKGDVWLIKGGGDATDLTGTRIRSVSSGSNSCKPIAVFSGSQKISITCTNTPTSGDNLFQQCFPVAAWGKTYVSAPTAGLNYSNNVYRVMINPDSTSTVVKLNGVTLPGSVPGISPTLATLTPGAPITMSNGRYYEFVSSTPVKIESTIPVMVSQYITNNSKCGNSFSGTGDPDMIYLSPVEQTIDSIIVSPVPSTNNNAFNYLNVYMKTVDVPNFTIRNQLNVTVPVSFTPMAIDPTFSYAQVALTNGYSTGVFYRLKTTSGGFNAIAYGYDQSESYAYNAGTNVKNLNRTLLSANPLSTGGVSKICKGTPTKLAIALPYIPTNLVWDFAGNSHISPNSNITVNNPVVDSTYMSGSTRLYVFRLSTLTSFDTIGIFPIKVTATNPSPDGCNGAEDINFDVKVVGGPLANFDWTFSGCGSNPAIFNDRSTDTLHTIQRWMWDFGNLSGTSTSQNPTYTFNAGGSFNVKLRVINTEGCYDDTTKTFTIQNSPTANFGFSGISCVTKNITFTDSSSINSGTITKWYWDYADGKKDTFSVSTNPSHVFMSSGVFNVTLTVENSNGCRSQKMKPVAIGNTPVPDFTLPGNICLPGNNAAFINNSSVLGGGSMTYTWNFGDATPLSNATSPVHTYADTGSYSVKLTASIGTCSRDTVKIFKTLFKKPLVDFKYAPEVCLNTPSNFKDTTQLINQTISIWNWKFDDGGVASSSTVTHTFATGGAHSIKLIVTTDKGCVDSNSHTLNVNLLPTAIFSLSSPLCQNQTVTFTDASVPNAGSITEWDWIFGDGTHQLNQAGSSVTHVYSNANTYPVNLVVKTDKGCYSNALPQNIVVNAVPKTDFGYPLGLCNPVNVNFNNLTTIADGTLSQIIYKWYFGDGDSSANVAPIHNYTAGGQFNINLIATSNNGCVFNKNKTIIIGSQPAVSVSISNTGNICSNLPLQLINNSFVPAGGYGTVDAIKFNWSFPNITDTLLINNPTLHQTITHQYPVFGTPATVPYTINVRVFNGSCYKDSLISILVHAAPKVQFDTIPSICEEALPVVLSQAHNTTGLLGTGLYSGTGVMNGTLFSPQMAGAGIDSITYTFTGTNGCMDRAVRAVEVYPTPLLELGFDKTVLEGDIVSIIPEVSDATSLSYTWSPANYLNDIHASAPLCKPFEDIRYYLQVVSAEGCKNFDNIFIKVAKDFEVPNTFTPNGDGINDRWSISNMSVYPNYRAQVFNRYGQVIFDSKNNSGDWDGTLNGTAVPSGTYYYVIDLDGARPTKKGYVTIIR